MGSRLRSLGRGVAFGSVAEALSAAADRIAGLHPGAKAEDLLRRMMHPRGHHASLRGKLLLMEIACQDLGEPMAFYLLGTAADIVWRGAPLRLLLFGLYHPEAIQAYAAASARLYQEALTPQSIRLWLDGRFWPEDGP